MLKLGISVGIVMTLAVTSIALAQKKPDFSGRWELEAAAPLVPTEKPAPLVQRALRTITQTAQLISVRSEVKGGKPVTIEHHLDGRESELRVEKGTWKHTAKWDADKLVVAAHFLGDDRSKRRTTEVWSIKDDVLTVETTGDNITGLRTVYKRVK
jgi:hypothetical protein